MEQNDDLFGNLDSKMGFLEDKKTTSTANRNDGLLKIDLTKVKDKKRGYRMVLRFLPNLTKEGKVGESAISKISHYVNIKNVKELSGFYDSPKNFPNEKCALSDLYYTLTKSNNALMVEKAKQLQYSKKYYSYVLVMEDEQCPENVGRIMIWQYGKTISDKISQEKNGEITGEPCNVFDLSAGKDFVLIAKEIQTGDATYPDYKMSTFKGERTPISLFSKESGQFKQVPLVEGKVDPRLQGRIREFLLDREYNLEDFAPKRLTEEQQSKVSQIVDLLTGKSSLGFTTSASNTSKASSNDFEFESNFDDTPAVSSGTAAVKTTTEDDFFDDF